MTTEAEYQEQYLDWIKAHQVWLSSKGKQGKRLSIFGLGYEEESASFSGFGPSARVKGFNAAIMVAKSEWRNSLYEARGVLKGTICSLASTEQPLFDLRKACFRHCDLRYTDLSFTDLSDAIFDACDFQYQRRCFNSRFHRAQFTSCTFWNAELDLCSFERASFIQNNFQGTVFQSSDLLDIRAMDCMWQSADLGSAKNVPGFLITALRRVPEQGSFIGFKKLQDNRLAKLLITEDALRSNATGFKCRASRAVVLKIYGVGWNSRKQEWEIRRDCTYSQGISGFDSRFIYEVGATVVPEFLFDSNPWHECTSGIHFFMSEQEALDWTI